MNRILEEAGFGETPRVDTLYRLVVILMALLIIREAVAIVFLVLEGIA